jgi:hypothetical protein
MTIFAPPHAGSRSDLPWICTTPRLKGSTVSRANTVSAELLNIVRLADRRRRDQHKIARYSSEEVAVHECVGRRRLQ